MTQAPGSGTTTAPERARAELLLAPDMAISAVNPAAEQLLGQGARRLVGKRVTDVLAFEEPLIMNRLADAETQLVARRVRVSLSGHAPRPLDVMTAPVQHHPGWQMVVLHEMSGVEGLSDDTGGDGDGDSATLRAPEVLAHEIKNPLAGIRGAAQLLDRKLGAGDRALTGLITSEVDRIAKLIDQMQSLSRRIREPASPCNLHEAVRRAEAVIMASDPGAVVIDEEFDPSLPMRARLVRPRPIAGSSCAPALPAAFRSTRATDAPCACRSKSASATTGQASTRLCAITYSILS